MTTPSSTDDIDLLRNNGVKRLCVLGGQVNGSGFDSGEISRTLAQLMARAGVGLVFHRDASGTIDEMAKIITLSGGQAIEVVECSQPSASYEIEVDARISLDSLQECKEKIFTIADGIVVIPGNINAIDFLMEYLTWMPRELGQRPVYIINTANYWKFFFQMFEKMKVESFLPSDFHGRYISVEDVADVLPHFLSTKLSKI